MAGKRGPWSSEEREFIEQNAGRLTPQQMGEQLNRDPEAIQKYIKEGMYGSSYKMAKTAETYLTKTPTWEELKMQFTKEELDIFLYHWGRIVAQFKDDVLPTEEMQIIDTIKLDILMNRILKTQQQTSLSISRLEMEMSNEVDFTRLDNLNRQIGILRASQTNSDMTYRDLLVKKESILKSMRATREARTKNLDSSNKNFTTWLKQLIEDKELRKELGLKMEKMRLASELEMKRLSQYHKYADGVLDKPIYNSETVDE